MTSDELVEGQWYEYHNDWTLKHASPMWYLKIVKLGEYSNGGLLTSIHNTSGLKVYPNQVVPEGKLYAGSPTMINLTYSTRESFEEYILWDNIRKTGLSYYVTSDDCSIAMLELLLLSFPNHKDARFANF